MSHRSMLAGALLVGVGILACQKAPGVAGDSLAAPGAVSPDDSAPAAPGASSTHLADPIGDWTLVALEGKPAPLGAGDKPATLSFTGTGQRAAGFGGCNHFRGPYENDARHFKVGPLIMTKMACEGGGTKLETAYTSALGIVTGFALNGDTLSLLAGERVVARLAR